MESETSLPNLLCEEDESTLLNGEKDENFEFCSVSKSDSEFIEMLFQRERNFLFENDENPVRRERSWLKSARSDVIKWILEKRAVFGYHYRTAYLSLIYFDRFLARTCISDGKVWQIRILSVACLSLAAKMEECEVRSLREYSVEGYQFGGNLIQIMELIVLNTLEWKMISVTPFTYVNYFAAKFCGESSRRELVIRAGELILALMKEINVAERRPSIIAAAAVLAADDYHLTKTIIENKMDAISLWGSFDKERTFSCYCQLQEILKLVKTPKSDISPNLLSSNVVDDSTIKSRGTRRRLDLDNRDQHCPARKISRS